MLFLKNNIAICVSEIGPTRYRNTTKTIEGYENGILLITPFVKTSECEGFRLHDIELRGEEAIKHVEDNFQTMLDDLNETHQAGGFDKYLAQAMPQEFFVDAGFMRCDQDHDFKWLQLSPHLLWSGKRFDWTSILQTQKAGSH